MATLSLRRFHRRPHVPEEQVRRPRRRDGLSYMDVSQVWQASVPSPEVTRPPSGPSISGEQLAEPTASPVAGAAPRPP